MAGCTIRRKYAIQINKYSCMYVVRQHSIGHGSTKSIFSEKHNVSHTHKNTQHTHTWPMNACKASLCAAHPILTVYLVTYYLVIDSETVNMCLITRYSIYKQKYTEVKRSLYVCCVCVSARLRKKGNNVSVCLCEK